MNVRQYLASRLQSAANAISPETWEEMKAREAREFLMLSREREIEFVANGNPPFGYMPRVMGDVMGGRLPVTDLTTTELVWWADDCVRSRRVNEGLGYAIGIAKDQAYLDVAVAALKRRGVGYAEPSATPPVFAPPPLHDPSRGR